jgi:hypothetical protein
MKKKLTLSIDEDLVRTLKKKRLNISRTVEKLLLKDMALSNERRCGGDLGSNPGGAIFCFFFSFLQDLNMRVNKVHSTFSHTRRNPGELFLVFVGLSASETHYSCQRSI